MTKKVQCECPLCDGEIDLSNYEENELLECQECGTTLEVVSLTPPVLEEAFDEED